MSISFSDRYPLPPFQERDPDRLALVVRAFPLATLISQNTAAPMITEAPLILYPDRGERGTLIGHMDRNNPHAALMDEGAPVTALFRGPDSYMSPTIYPTRQYPGWNYIRVRVQGRSTVLRSLDQVKDSLVQMTDFLEWHSDPYRLDRESQGVDRLARDIVAFEIEILDMKGIFKLAQDKGPRAAALAKDHLVERSKRDWSALLERLLDNDKTLS